MWLTLRRIGECVVGGSLKAVVGDEQENGGVAISDCGAATILWVERCVLGRWAAGVAGIYLKSTGGAGVCEYLEDGRGLGRGASQVCALWVECWRGVWVSDIDVKNISVR